MKAGQVNEPGLPGSFERQSTWGTGDGATNLQSSSPRQILQSGKPTPTLPSVLPLHISSSLPAFRLYSLPQFAKASTADLAACEGTKAGADLVEMYSSLIYVPRAQALTASRDEILTGCAQLGPTHGVLVPHPRQLHLPVGKQGHGCVHPKFHSEMKQVFQAEAPGRGAASGQK